MFWTLPLISTTSFQITRSTSENLYQINPGKGDLGIENITPSYIEREFPLFLEKCEKDILKFCT